MSSAPGWTPRLPLAPPLPLLLLLLPPLLCCPGFPPRSATASARSQRERTRSPPSPASSAQTPPRRGRTPPPREPSPSPATSRRQRSPRRPCGPPSGACTRWPCCCPRGGSRRGPRTPSGTGGPRCCWRRRRLRGGWTCPRSRPSTAWGLPGEGRPTTCTERAGQGGSG